MTLTIDMQFDIENIDLSILKGISAETLLSIIGRDKNLKNINAYELITTLIPCKLKSNKLISGYRQTLN